MPRKKLYDYFSPGSPSSCAKQLKRSRSSPELDKIVSKKVSLEEKMGERKDDQSVPLPEILKALSDLLDSKLASIKEDIKMIREESSALKEENCRLREDIDSMRRLIEKNENLIEEMDIKARSCNLIFRGLKYSLDDLPSVIISNFCKEILGVDLKADSISAHYLGSKDKQNCPLLAKFSSFQDKLSVLTNLKILKNTGFVVHQDFPASIRVKRAKLLLIRKEAVRLKPNLKVSLRADSLFIQGNKFKWSNTKGIRYSEDDGIKKLNEILGGDISQFIDMIISNCLPRDYFLSKSRQDAHRSQSAMPSASAKKKS